MVKSSDYEKDIRAISEKVGTAVFTYDEIHNEDVGSKYKYDYQKVIDEVSRLNGCDMTEELLERGILSILPDGEYKVNVGSTTKGGGGLNYGGTAFFSYDKSDISTHYHELAHSLQKHYNLFDENMLDEIYNESGNDLNDKEKEEKLIDRYTYSHYLNEMHSESFAYAARMLRADNWWEFTKEAVVAYSNGIMSNSVGFLDPRKKYGSNPALKYYSSYPVMKETIKQIYDIRKQKKLGEYFDENGIINDEKTARLAENIVKEKGYSPRTLNSYFNYNALDRHKDNEHGWRRDSLKSLVIFLPTLVLETSTTLKEFADFVQSRVKHLELSAREKFMVNKFLLSPISKNKSPEEKALEAYQKIRIKCSIADEKYENSYMGIHLLDRLDNALDKGGYPQAYLNNFSDIISNYTTFFNKSRYEAGFRHTSRYVNKLIKENKDNPYFKSLIKGQVNDFDLQKMIIEKKKDKNKQVIPLDLEAKRDKSGFAHIPIRFMVKTVEEFSDKYNISKDIKDKMLKAVVNEPEIFENKEFRKQMFNQIKPNDFLSTIKGTTGSMRTDFYKAMDKVASSYFSFEGKDKFMKPLSELKNVAPDDLLSTIETKLEDEREAYRLSREENNNTDSNVVEKNEDEQSDNNKQTSEPVLENKSASKYLAPDNETDAIAHHLQFLIRKEQLLKKYPEIDNLGIIIDESYRYALTNKEIQSKSINIIREGGLSKEFLDDWKEFNNFVGDSAFSVNKSNYAKMYGMIKKDTLELKEKKENNPLENVLDGKKSDISYDDEYKALYAKISFELYKSDMIKKYPEIPDVKNVLQNMEDFYLKKENTNTNINISYKTKGTLDPYLKGCFEADLGKSLIEARKFGEKCKNNPFYEKIANLDIIEVTKIYEEKRNNPDIPLNEKVFENHNLTNMDNKEPNRTVADYTEAKEKAVILDEDTKKTIKDIDRITGSIFSQAMFIDDFSQNKLDAIMNTGMLIQAEAGNGKLSNSIEKAFNERFENNNVFNDKDKVLLSEFVKNTTAENNKETSSSNLKDAYFNANYKDTQKNKNAEEILIDNIIKSGIFSNEENELLNIAVSVEENRLKGNTNNSASYSEDFMNKVIQSENISEKSKEKLLNMSIKTENQEIFEKEGGTRLYFDKDKFDKFSKLKLSKEVVEALDIKLEDERFSLKIPEDDKLKKQLLNSIKVSSALEKLNQMKRGEKVDTSKPVPKNVSVGLKALLNTQSER